MINFLTKFFVTNVTTQVFPGQGMFTVLIFFIEFHLDFYILDNYKSSVHTVLSSSVISM